MRGPAPLRDTQIRDLGHPRLLLCGMAGAQAELNLATMAYNLKTPIKALGAAEMISALA